MSIAGDSQAIYKKRLDKWRARSTRLFNRAQNLNRTLDRQLTTSIKGLENTRDISIRRDLEKIWMVTGSGLRAPKYVKDQEDIPAYLGKRVNATMPTPHELSSLLPSKKAKQRTQRTGSYAQLSKRRLSHMSTGDLNIYHYRKALESVREQHASPALYGEVITENEGEGGTGDIQNEQTWASSTGLTLSLDSKSAIKQTVRPTTAIPTSSTTKPPHPERPKTSIPSAARRKRRESVPNAAALMIEQAQDPKNRVLRTNFLEMYQRQLSKHQRRMSAMKEKQLGPQSVEPNGRSETDSPDNGSRPRTAIGMISEEDEGDGRLKSAGFMADTSSSTMRRSPLTIKQRLRRTSMAAVSGMNTLHNEVKSLQSFRKFKQENLGVLENDIPSVEDLEEGELFDEMRKCRYIRWGEDEEKVAVLNEDQPLVNQLKMLSIDTTKKPKRFLKKIKEQPDPGD